MYRRFLEMRKIKMVEVCSQVMRTIILFNSILQDHENKVHDFDKIAAFVDDKGESVLFEIKGSCHFLYRHNTMLKVRSAEKLFDLIVGALFHHAMKIREEVYQKQNYFPRLKEIMDKEDKTPYEEELSNNFKFLQLDNDLDRQLKKACDLVEGLRLQFLSLLPLYEDNDLLIRYILEHKDLLEKAMGPGGQDLILDKFYLGDRRKTLTVAGMSYMESGFFQAAIEVFEKIDELEKLPEAVFLHRLALGLQAFHEGESELMLKELSQGIDNLEEGEVTSRQLELMKAYLNELLHLEKNWPSAKSRRIADTAESLLQRIETVSRVEQVV